MEAIKLLQLADFLEFEVGPLQARVGKRKFDMRQWCGVRRMRQARKLFKNDPTDCQTASCAVGWATVLFPRQGLKLIRCGTEESGFAIPFYKGESEYRAAAAFFGIDEWEASQLFGPEDSTSPDTPCRVADNIREFVGNKWHQEDQEVEENANARNSLAPIS